METLNVSAPVVVKKWWKLPAKVWIGIAVGISGLLIFLYWFYRKKQKEAELLKEKETEEEKNAEKEEPKEIEASKEEVIKTTEIIEDIPDTQEFLNQALRQNLHLPALSFNPDWEIIPLLPQANSPVRFRIFNQTGQAPVDISLDKNEDKIAWQVMTNGLTIVQVPLNDATQLRAIIASFLQQVSPVTLETDETEKAEDTNTNE